MWAQDVPKGKSVRAFLSCLILTCGLQSAQADFLTDSYEELAKQLQSQAWQNYQTKLLQILESYSYEHSARREIVFWSDDLDSCPNKHKGRTKYAIRFKGDVEATRFTQVIQHETCGIVGLTETIQAEGPEVVPLSELEIFTGIRPFLVQKQETRRRYVVRNHFDEILYSTDDLKKGDDRFFQFHIAEDLHSSLFLSGKGQRIVFESGGVHIKWKFSRNGRYNTNYGVPTETFIVSEEALGNPAYYSQRAGKFISMHKFKSYLAETPLHVVSVAPQGFIELWAKHFVPAASFASTGSAGDRLKEELRKLVESLQANVDEQRVIATLIELIEAVEAGKIRDLRE